MVQLDVLGRGMTSPRTRDRLVQRLKQEGIRHEAVLDAVGQVPRHLFLDEALSHRAYEDTALPIGLGQTLSQPYVVAKMTEAVLQDRGASIDSVLEIGTGSGYQAAVLSCVAKRVYSIERISALLKKAQQRFRDLRLINIQARHGDGYAGWPGTLKFDGILVTAAPEQVPEALLKQLKEGGVLVIPEGGEERQELKIYRRVGDTFPSQIIELVKFVPLLPGTM